MPTSNATALYGVAALAANDVWAVGQDYTAGSLTLTMHWNGSAWSVVPSPNIGEANILYAVAAVAANDVWAVGSHSAQLMILHWNGSQWSLVPTPPLVANEAYLLGIDAVAANDVWAVGYYRNGPPYNFNTLVLHWDGNTWSVAPSPSPGGAGSLLTAVDAVSAKDVWAVGSTYDSTSGPSHAQTMHWDGNTWSVVPTPPDVPLSGVSAVASNDVWAVGSNGLYMTSMHWDGNGWSVVPVQDPAIIEQLYLQKIAAVAANDVWAVGYYYNTATGRDETLVEHWDGSSWQIVPSPNLSTNPSELYDVAAVSAHDVWAVGYAFQTLVERYNNPCASKQLSR